MIYQYRRHYKVNCLICGEKVSESYVLADAKQKIYNKTCKNKHEFFLDIGGNRCETMYLTEE